MRMLPVAAALLVLASTRVRAQFEGVELGAQIAAMQAAKIGRHPAPPVRPASPFSDRIRAEFGVRGIDVSHYENEIDWAKVAQDDVSFAYIKATDGDTIVDAEFQDNWKEAAAAGLARGAYHFYNFCKGVEAQAALFIRTVPPDSTFLPPTIDLERSKECGAKKMPGKARFRKDLDAFVAIIRTAYGKEPILYVEHKLYDKYFAGDPGDFRLWIPDYSKQPVLSDKRPWLFWQLSEKGRVSGISGDVDLDVFSGAKQDLAALASGPVEYALK